MDWIVKNGDILDEPADALICSANPFLTLSGGVGGALHLRYGDHLCRELEAYLEERGKRYLDRGSVVVTRPAGVPYKAVIHGVAVDGMYDSSVEIVTGVLRGALSAAGEAGAKRVAVTALATGYGRLSVEDFARGVAGLAGETFGPVERATIVLRDADDTDAIRRVLA